jgi:hypothetical protein
MNTINPNVTLYTGQELQAQWLKQVETSRIKATCWRLANELREGALTPEDQGKFERGCQWLNRKGEKQWVEDCLRRAGCNVPPAPAPKPKQVTEPEVPSGYVKLACGDTVPEDSLRNYKLMFGKFAGLTLLEIAEGTKGSRWLEDENGVLRGRKLPDGFEVPFTWISDYDGVNFLDWLAGQPCKDEEEVCEITSGRLKGTKYKRKGWVYRDTHDAITQFLAHPSMQRKLQESLSPRCFDGKESIPVLLRRREKWLYRHTCAWFDTVVYDVKTRERAVIGHEPISIGVEIMKPEEVPFTIDNELAPYASSEQAGDSRIDNSKFRNHGIPLWLEVKPSWQKQVEDPDPTPGGWSLRGYAIEEGAELQADDGWQESVKEEPDFDWRPRRVLPLTERRCWEEGIGWLVRLEALASMSDGTVTPEELIERCEREKVPFSTLTDELGDANAQATPLYVVPEPWVVDMLTELNAVAKEIRERFCITLEGGKRVLREQVPERLIEELRKAYAEAEERIWGLLAERYPNAAEEHEASLEEASEETLEAIEILTTAYAAEMQREARRRRRNAIARLALIEEQMESREFAGI